MQQHTFEQRAMHSTLTRSCDKLQVTTWRPARSCSQALRSACCGGSPQLADVSYVRAPAGAATGVLSRFGFRTQSSGTLQVNPF